MKAWLCFREYEFQPVNDDEWGEVFPGFELNGGTCPICEHHVSNQGCSFQNLLSPYVDYNPQAPAPYDIEIPDFVNRNSMGW